MSKNNNRYGSKFYSKSDMSLGSNLEKAEYFIENIYNSNNTSIENDINYYLEMYNVELLINANIKLTSWSDEHYNYLKEKTKNFKKIIYSYFHLIDCNDILTLYKSIEQIYLEDFWTLISKSSIYKNIPYSSFELLLNYNKFSINYIIKHKNVVDYFQNEIKSYMISNPTTSTKILIDYYLLVNNNIKDNIYLPSNFLLEEKLDILIKYINSDNPNPNYLDSIINAKSNSNFAITDEIKYMAKLKFKSLINEIFDKCNALETTIVVAFACIDDYFKLDLSNKLSPKFIYNISWIEENLDYPTLLNNFIYLFCYVDRYFRFSFTSKNNQSNFLDFMRLKNKSYYNTDENFTFCNDLSLMQIIAYYNILSNNHIYLENIIKWFFEDYLKLEFNIDGFIFNAPTIESSYLEKCRHLCSELDSILKQFSLYTQYKEIDRELFEISSSTPSFSNIKSIIKNKYAYLENKDLEYCSDILFSNKTLLSNSKVNNYYENLEELLLNESIRLSDFSSCYINQIKTLLNNNIIFEDKDKFLQVYKDKVLLLKDFYFNDVICCSYLKENKFLQDLINTKRIKLENTLFSKPEQNYLDYMLNDHKFSNGPKLRNKYIHGSNSLDTEQHKQDYYNLLKIFISIIIKINEEFCLKYSK